MVAVLALFVCLVLFPIIHGLLPWGLSHLSNRHGWTDNHRAIWTWLGLIPLVIGIAGQIWILVTVLQTVPLLPPRVPLGLDPVLLMTSGPYALSRNPIYVADIFLWVGWALFFGSATVLIGLIALLICGHYVVRREERQLEALFGEQYRQYKRVVPRWLGAVRRMNI
jgi:protein-S-isoprenylcysteine O-methyltransferase Ste14